MASQQQHSPLQYTFNPLVYNAAYHPAAGHQFYHDPGFAGLGYRVPPPPPQQHHHRQSQHPHQPPAFVASAFTNSAVLHQQQQQQHHQQQHHRLPFHTRRPAQQRLQDMASEFDHSAVGMTEEEMAEMQKLSNEYQPEAKGPLVGLRQSSTAITEEYAKADAKYQVKTASLPHKYSHYRTVRGDGKCGWRAIAYGYFEVLIHLGDANKFVEEEARLRSLANTCSAANYDIEMVQDFADETFDLLRDVAKGLHDGTAENVLHERFNDDTVQNYIITHFRTLTAAWMKTHANDYSPWILDHSVDEYVNISVMPVSCELEHVSMTALKDVLLSPAGITLEVNYLDRSDGEEINMHRMGPSINGYDIGTIRLLYRPGHYDLLYMLQDFPTISAPAPRPTVVPTYLYNGSQLYVDHVFETPSAFDWMTSIPGGSYINPNQAWMSNSNYGSTDFFSAPVQPCPQPVPSSIPTAPQPQMQAPTVYASATPTQLDPPPMQMPEELAIRVAHTAQPTFAAPNPFRSSTWQLASDHTQQMPLLQTAQFRNSHFNVAHFLNPAFQPDQWHPDDEYKNSG